MIEDEKAPEPNSQGGKLSAKPSDDQEVELDMGRPAGTHNEDYELKRSALLDAIGAHLIQADTDRASFREMAAVAGVSVPTLRHYFSDRDGVLKAWLAYKGSVGQPFLGALEEPGDEFEKSIRDAVTFVLRGLDRGRVIDLHVIGLSEGLTNRSLGPAYLNSILEPTLRAMEARLQAHVSRGQMRSVDVRVASIALLSPLLMAVMHQRELGGSDVRCLDLDAFVSEHVAAFSRAYSV